MVGSQQSQQRRVPLGDAAEPGGADDLAHAEDEHREREQAAGGRAEQMRQNVPVLSSISVISEKGSA